MLKSLRAPDKKAAGFKRKARGSYSKSPREFYIEAAGFLNEGQEFEKNNFQNVICLMFELRSLVTQSSTD